MRAIDRREILMPPRRGAAAKKRAMGGPIAIMVRKRTICSVMMKGSSTWLDAAMIATESMPPGLVAR